MSLLHAFPSIISCAKHDILSSTLSTYEEVLTTSQGAKPIPGEKDKKGTHKIRYFWGAKHAVLVEPTEYGAVFLYEEVFTAIDHVSTSKLGEEYPQNLEVLRV